MPLPTSWEDIWGLVLQLGAALLVLALAYHFLFGRQAEFVIRVRDGRVEQRGRKAVFLGEELRDFLLNDLAPAGPIQILGTWAGGRLRLWFRGRLSAGDKQRIRNFLLSRV